MNVGPDGKQMEWFLAECYHNVHVREHVLFSAQLSNLSKATPPCSNSFKMLGFCNLSPQPHPQVILYSTCTRCPLPLQKNSNM